MLQSMGPQRVGHDLVTEEQQGHYVIVHFISINCYINSTSDHKALDPGC